jgi:hypothetical protein
MKNILRYVVVVTIPVGYLIWLAIVLSSRPSDKEILDTVSTSGWLLALTNLALPVGKKSVWARICLLPSLLVIASWAWFYFRLSPVDERLTGITWFTVIAAIGVGVWLCHIAYQKWWPSLSIMSQVVMTATAIILSGGALIYLAVLGFRSANWHDILITDWYVTVLVLYLPVFIGALFIRNALEKRKTERKMDAQTPPA